MKACEKCAADIPAGRRRCDSCKTESLVQSRARKVAAQKKKWQDPVFRKARCEGDRRRWAGNKDLREKRAAYHKTAAFKEKRSEYRFRTRYGLTKQDRVHMQAAQHNKCAICGDVTVLVVDHNHRTGRVRRLLCVRCNAGLGQFMESPLRLLGALQYLMEEEA